MNENQPRVPAGQPGGGEWTSDHHVEMKPIGKDKPLFTTRSPEAMNQWLEQNTQWRSLPADTNIQKRVYRHKWFGDKDIEVTAKQVTGQMDSQDNLSSRRLPTEESYQLLHRRRQ